MLRNILAFSTAILLAGNLTANIDNKISESEIKIAKSNISYQIAQAKTYRVKLGDTLGGIAQRVGVSLNQILDFNPQLRSRPSLIYVGEMINLGSSTTPSPAPSSKKYTVRSGDTLGGIAIRHGLSLQTIIAYNPQLAARLDRINVGETINVGSAQIVRPPQSTPTPAKPTTDSRVAGAFSNLPTARRQGSNSIGARRGHLDEVCTKGGKDLRAIAPENGLGFTFDDYPYFFWYFPGIESESDYVPVIFTLIGQEKREINGQTKTRPVSIYETELNLDDQSGIVAFPLPAESKPLQEEQEYQWRIQINCTEQTTMFLKYSIKRQSTNNPELTRKLETTTVDRHPVVFAESGIWFDALKIVALQLEQAPGDPILEKDWNNILKLIGFEDLIGEPIQYIH
ncbi:MAG: DUF928 domain-containing protein [Xenococcus sp. (in: cyanobacteria)]